MKPPFAQTIYKHPLLKQYTSILCSNYEEVTIMMSYIISKVSQNTSGNSKYVDRADAIERFLQQKRDAKAAQRAQASNSNKEITTKTDK